MKKEDLATIEKKTFAETTAYQLIYAYAIDDKAHRGMVKVGKTSLASSLPPEKLPPCCKALNDAAHKRIKGQTGAAAIDYRLLYTELAVRTRMMRGGRSRTEHFTDKKVHAVLKNSGFPHKFIGNTKGMEWFGCDLATVKAAIAAVKNFRAVISGGGIERDDPIELRDEQKEAVRKTLKCFFEMKKGEMLWDAKMRFGKTLTALQLVREGKGKFRRVAIITHRPVVGGGWQEDFNKLFTKKDGYTFYVKGSIGGDYEFEGRLESQNDKRLAALDASGERFIYFASIQDLRGSKAVGGKFDKNRGVFAMDWDLLIVDEAHEGTQTDLGREVRALLVKKHTKVLSLSGTPFNILSQYDADSTFVWDYVMEQRRKAEWEEERPEVPNPYAALPRLNLFVYGLGEVFANYFEEDFDGKFFKFREFFRTWTGDRLLDGAPLPKGVAQGCFVHEDDVRRFLDLVSGDDLDSRFPFATQSHRDLFRHTLWVVPGVAAAKALSALLQGHRYFSKYAIANVAGEGDDYEEQHFDNALALVQKKIRENEYTITLSCGKLTTGVTVPEWTGVMLLYGGATTSAAQYMQTIFRVQSPGDLGGRMKTNCYAFDFSPDRTVKVVAESVRLTRRSVNPSASSVGDGEEAQRQRLREFLDFCPVISFTGSQMVAHDVRRLMAAIKQVFIVRTIRNGFDDLAIYDTRKLMALTDSDLAKFETLNRIVGSTKQTKAPESVVVNKEGFDGDGTMTDGDDAPPARRPLTDEEKARREEQKRRRKERDAAVSNLRAISIRMPLLIYGADVPVEKVISISDFPSLVDDESWAEFMPPGVTKSLFRRFVEYYDADVFAEAGTQIRRLAKSADALPPTKRAMQIARIFSYFKNPDKETVLTPWRVVNLHMAETLGGWCFYGRDFPEEPLEDGPRKVAFEDSEAGGTSETVFFKSGAKILEINSKSGLYPLYCAYSLYRARLGDVPEEAVKPAETARIWRDVLAKQVFVVCKTPMARSITVRTLAGYDAKATINAQYIPGLVEMLAGAPRKFRDRVCGGNAWNNKEFSMKMLKFDAVVGNPPYQVEVARKASETNGQARRKSIFQYFQMAADEVTSGCTSLVYPGGRWIHRSGKGMEEFGLGQINDPRLAALHFWPDWSELFPTAEIADGLSIVVKEKGKTASGFKYIYHKGGRRQVLAMLPPGESLMPLDPNDASIIAKIRSFRSKHGLKSIADRVLARSLFGIESDFVEKNPKAVRPYREGEVIDWEREIKLFTNDRAGKAGRAKWFVAKRSVIEANPEAIGKWKVVVSSANAGGQKRDWQLEILDNHSAFGRARVALGLFDTRKEAENFFRYCQTPLVRFLFLMTDEALTSLAKEVPDIGDYRGRSQLIDFKGDIGRQLAKLAGLSKTESDYAACRIADIDASRSKR